MDDRNEMSHSEDEGQEDWTDTGWAQPIEISGTNSGFIQKKCPSTYRNELADSSKAKNDGTEMQNLKSEVLQVLSAKTNSDMSRMSLNDNKAGMKGLDKERINQIIAEASKGSRFYENERKKEEQLKKRVVEQRQKVESLSEAQLQQGLIKADQLLEELKASRTLDRHIVHIDMDAFYAAVEMRENPSLRDKPMAVGGSDMLATSNYHARRFGVRAAMPGFIGKKLCPELIIVPHSFDKYTAVSKQVREILAEYDPNFSTMSLDEAYLDFTHHVQQRCTSDDKNRTFLARTNSHFDLELCFCDPNLTLLDWLISQEHEELHHGKVINMSCLKSSMLNENSYTDPCSDCGKNQPDVRIELFGTSVEEAVREMRFRIEQRTRLTASAGIAPNTMLAKVCSDYNKPNGQYRVQPTITAVMDFMNDLPLRKVGGIGNVSDKMLKAIGVQLCSDLYHKRALLYHLYSPISFNYFMRVCLGIGSTRIERDGERKSISTERSFREMDKPPELYSKCEELCSALWDDLNKEKFMGKTFTLKLKTVGFDVKTRAHTLPDFTNSIDVIREAAKSLLSVEIQAMSPKPLRLRLMGVRLSNLIHVSQYTKQQQKTITDMFKQVTNPQPPSLNQDQSFQKHLDPNHEETCCNLVAQHKEPKHLDPQYNILDPTQLEPILVEQNYPLALALQHLGSNSKQSNVSQTHHPKHLHLQYLEDSNMVIKENNMVIKENNMVTEDNDIVSKDTNLIPKPSILVTKDDNSVAKYSNLVTNDSNLVTKDSKLKVKESNELKEGSPDSKQIYQHGISELSIAQESSPIQSQFAIDSINKDIGENASTQILSSNFKDVTALNKSSSNSGGEQCVEVEQLSTKSSVDTDLLSNVSKLSHQSQTTNAVDKILPSSDNQKWKKNSSRLSPQKSLKSPKKITPDKTLSPLQKMFSAKIKSLGPALNSGACSEQSLHTCPICEKEILSKSVNDINYHVDECLKKPNHSSSASMIEKSSNYLNGKKTWKNIGKYFSKISNVDTKDKIFACGNNSMTFTLPRLELLNDLTEETILIKEPTAFSHHDSEHIEGIQDSSRVIDEKKIENFTNSEHDKDATKLNLFSSIKSDRIFTESENLQTINESSQPNISSEQAMDKNICNSGSPACAEVVDTTNSQTDRQKYMCPVCNIVFAVSLGRFNDHVDRCLNQPTISTIIQETNSQILPGRKRSSMERSPSAPSAKRKKIQTRSIMSYLKP